MTDLKKFTKLLDSFGIGYNYYSSKEGDLIYVSVDKCDNKDNDKIKSDYGAGFDMLFTKDDENFHSLIMYGD